MARTRDNWLILVTAVLKKQQFLELCRAESKSPSMCSEASDLSSLVTLSSPFNFTSLTSSPFASDDDQFANSPIVPVLESNFRGGEDRKSITVMLKLELHCQCCAESVRRLVSQFKGVEKVETDCDANILAVTGDVDPKWIRNRVQHRTKKRVELLKIEFNDREVNDKKPKETVVWIKMDCEECERKLRRSVEGMRGVTSIDVSQQNKLTVIGYVDPEKATHRTGTIAMQVPYNNVVEHPHALHVSEKFITTQRFDPQPHQSVVGSNEGYYNQDYGLPMYHHQQQNRDYSYGYTLPQPSFDIFSDENPNGCCVM